MHYLMASSSGTDLFVSKICKPWLRLWLMMLSFAHLSSGSQYLVRSEHGDDVQHIHRIYPLVNH